MIDVIWTAELDGKYVCEVHRESDYVGKLLIFNGKHKLFSEKVMLAYGSQFGPDVSDVAKWQDRCLEYIDSL